MYKLVLGFSGALKVNSVFNCDRFA